jgi:hypothetical protein
MATAARDILTASDRDNLAVVAARSVPVTRARPHSLPTPPNSISPALPPHGLKAQLARAKLDAISSDLDLQDEPDEERANDRVASLGSPPDDSAGAISSAMLAKFHLPDILLNHGPLAIRHVMGYLTTSVPGFAGIPPAKARRLVVGALEGRGTGGEGGLDGDVVFEKVGWGRWDAKRRGQQSRHSALAVGLDESGILINKGGNRLLGRQRPTRSGSSEQDNDAVAFSHDDREAAMPENEADKMSMDGSASASCSSAPDDDVIMNDDPEDITDDEDWAAVGAAALRASSYSNAAPNRGERPLYSRVYSAGAAYRSFTGNAGMARAPVQRNFDNLASALAGTSDAQEREAVEALLRLGSV